MDYPSNLWCLWECQLDKEANSGEVRLSELKYFRYHYAHVDDQYQACSVLSHQHLKKKKKKKKKKIKKKERNETLAIRSDKYEDKCSALCSRVRGYIKYNIPYNK